MCEIKQPVRKRQWKSELFQDYRAIWTHLEQPQFRFETKRKIWKLFEPKHRNFKCILKIEGSVIKCLNIKRLMSISSPLKQFHCQAISIWWHSPFKVIVSWDFLCPHRHHEKQFRILQIFMELFDFKIHSPVYSPLGSHLQSRITLRI